MNENLKINGIEGIIFAVPEIFLFCSILFLIPINLFFFKNTPFKNCSKFSYFSIIITLLLVIFIPYKGTAFSELFYISDYQKYIKILILISILSILMISIKKAEIEGINFPEFNYLILLSTCGMMIVVSANNLMTLYLALELQALPIYILCSLRKKDIRSAESGLKYFLLGALSSGFLLFGMSLIYGFSGSLYFNEIMNNTTQANLGLNFGLIFLISGIAFKISAAPFHMWSPDVYQGSPTPVTLLIASAPKITAISILIILTYNVFKNVNKNWIDLITVLCLASMIVGSVGAVVQSNIKRLLAYSGISHIGFMLVGLVSFSSSGLEGILFYLTIYLFLLIGVFSIILSLKKDNQPIELLSDLKGLSNNYPFLSISLLIFMFSMAGIPPLSGFFGKWFVFHAAIEKGYYILPIVGVIFSVVSAFYYLKIIKIMFFEVSDSEIIVEQDLELKLVLYFCLFFTCLAFLLIPILQNLILKSLI